MPGTWYDYEYGYHGTFLSLLTCRSDCIQTISKGIHKDKVRSWYAATAALSLRVPPSEHRQRARSTFHISDRPRSDCISVGAVLSGEVALCGQTHVHRSQKDSVRARKRHSERQRRISALVSCPKATSLNILNKEICPLLPLGARERAERCIDRVLIERLRTTFRGHTKITNCTTHVGAYSAHTGSHCAQQVQIHTRYRL